MKVLFIGDIIGRPGRNAVKKHLAEHSYDFVIANGENSAAGFGITDNVYREFMGMGISAVTGGNHTWDKPDTEKYAMSWENFIRPLNYPAGSPGRGFQTYEVCDQKILVTCLLGRVFMHPYDNPFEAFDKLYSQYSDYTIIVDFHGEATSEKNAFGLYTDSRATSVIGTHTHVQTNDLRLLPSGGTLYLTDAGMSGSIDSVIGMGKEAAIERYTSSFQRRISIELAGRSCFSGVVFEVEGKNRIKNWYLEYYIID